MTLQKLGGGWAIRVYLVKKSDLTTIKHCDIYKDGELVHPMEGPTCEESARDFIHQQTAKRFAEKVITFPEEVQEDFLRALKA